MPMKTAKLAALVVAAAGVLVWAPPAHADSIIKNPGDHPDYRVELEPHGLLGWGRAWGGAGLGLGARASIPIVRNGFVQTLNNSVAISFGIDWVRYSDCYYHWRGVGYGCGASFFMFPVAMQWNFWLTEKWSVFGEPGLHVYHATYDANWCDPRFLGCAYPTTTSVDFAFYAGGRFHFNDKVSLTMRIGYPTLSVGASFFL